jgi:hypothetical protein
MIVSLFLFFENSMNIMYTANYLGQSISISCATLRKMRKIPKDRAEKILFSRGIKNSSL